MLLSSDLFTVDSLPLVSTMELCIFKLLLIVEGDTEKVSIHISNATEVNLEQKKMF
jgi:hypothetical protein